MYAELRFASRTAITPASVVTSNVHSAVWDELRNQYHPLMRFPFDVNPLGFDRDQRVGRRRRRGRLCGHSRSDAE